MPVITLLPSALPAATRSSLRIGFIGAGPWGRRYLTWALQHRQLDVRAVCDADAAALQACKPLLSGYMPPDICNDYRQLLSRKDIDAVIIAAPWHQHYAIAKAALLAGKHVACGPVMGVTVAEHEDIVRTCERVRRQYFTLDEHSYRQDLMAVSRMAEQGLFGTLETVHAGASYEGLTPAHISQPLPYPVFPAAAVAGILGVHKGNQYVSLQVQRRETEYIANRQHPKKTAKAPVYIMRTQLLNMICLTTERQQTVYLQTHAGEEQPISTGFRVSGTGGHWIDVTRSIYINGQSPANNLWEPAAPYLQRYDHPQRNETELAYRKSLAGNDACACALNDFVRLLQQPAGKIYDAVYAAATNSVIGVLAANAKGGAVVKVPDFSAGENTLCS